MKWKNSWSLFVLVLLLVAPIRAQVHLISAQRMSVDMRYDSLSSVPMAQVMAGYKARLGEDLSRPIGDCAVSMVADMPESPLSNFLADQLFLKADQLISGGVDFSLINTGSIRASLKKGILTVADVFRVMPFENELVILELKGEDVWAVFKSVARSGGAGVSNVTLEMQGSKVSHLLIGGRTPEKEKVYRVVTLDYLADGNSGMTALLHAVKRINTGIKARDVYIEQIEKLTAQGMKVDAAPEGRIKLITK